MKTAYLVLTMMMFSVCLTGACTTESDTGIIKTVGSAGEARNAFLLSLRQQQPQSSPPENSVWQIEKRTYTTSEDGVPDITVGIINVIYVSGNWRIEITGLGVPPEGRVYDVLVTNDELNLGWFGKVYASGAVSQISQY